MPGSGRRNRRGPSTWPGAGRPFGPRLRDARSDNPGAGLIVLGSGSGPLASRTEIYGDLVAAAGDRRPGAREQQLFRDILAIPASVFARRIARSRGGQRPAALVRRPGGTRRRGLRSRWRLQVDLNSPLDGLLRGTRRGHRRRRRGQAAATPGARSIGPRDIGNGSGRWRGIPRPSCSSPDAPRHARCVGWDLDPQPLPGAGRGRVVRTAQPGQRPPRSVRGVETSSARPRRLRNAPRGRSADAALIDSRVLLAHRLGNDESGWPARRTAPPATSSSTSRSSTPGSGS